MLKPQYGTSTSITITLNSLASAAARESTAVDNTSNLYMDAEVVVVVKINTGTPGSDGQVYVYAYASEDGTNYGDNATGSDAALTMRTPTNLREIGSLSVPSNGTTYTSQPFSVAAAFGGILPRKWGIVVENKTNMGFDSSGCSARYTGLNLADL